MGNKSSFSAGVEYLISKKISLGGFYFKHDVLPIATNPASKISYHTIGVESNFHQIIKNVFDSYIGLRAGYRTTSFDQKELNSDKGIYKGDLTNSRLALGTQVGLRYHISDIFALMAEYTTFFDDDSDIIQGGIAVRL